MHVNKGSKEERVHMMSNYTIMMLLTLPRLLFVDLEGYGLESFQGAREDFCALLKALALLAVVDGFFRYF